MATVDLDRRFVEWTKDADVDPELWARLPGNTRLVASDERASIQLAD
jgi:hypothetical protein